MLSICIPVYNFNIVELITALHQQAQTLNLKSEILVIDDCSKDSYKIQNRAIEHLDGVRYVELAINVGRSKIRNLLATEAQYDYLLFMDCDSAIHPHYLANYVEQLSKSPAIICGGTIYNIHPPQTPFILHWKVGSSREMRSATVRNRYPNRSFASNNFVISRELITHNPFSESLSGYGHEDTLFGYHLKEKKIAILHIDNPVEHLGLDESVAFLNKQMQSAQNLLKLVAIVGEKAELVEDIRSLKVFLKFKRWHLTWLGAVCYQLLGSLIKYQLTGKNPNLQLFDLYKLLYLLHIDFCKPKSSIN